jgi:hypothetical protein
MSNNTLSFQDSASYFINPEPNIITYIGISTIPLNYTIYPSYPVNINFNYYSEYGFKEGIQPIGFSIQWILYKYDDPKTLTSLCNVEYIPDPVPGPPYPQIISGSKIFPNITFNPGDTIVYAILLTGHAIIQNSSISISFDYLFTETPLYQTLRSFTATYIDSPPLPDGDTIIGKNLIPNTYCYFLKDNFETTINMVYAFFYYGLDGENIITISLIDSQSNILGTQRFTSGSTVTGTSIIGNITFSPINIIPNSTIDVIININNTLVQSIFVNFNYAYYPEPIIYGFDNIGNYYYLNQNYPPTVWEIHGAANCISSGCDGTTIVCNQKNISVINIHNATLDINFPDVKDLNTYFTSVSSADINNTWGILYGDTNIYVYQPDSNNWTLIQGIGVQFTNVSVGYDGSVFVVDETTTVLQYVNNSWTKIIINNLLLQANQLAVVNSTNIWGIYNNTVFLYTNEVLLTTNPPLIGNVNITFISISASYDGTIWCTCNGILFERKGITLNNPVGSTWNLISVSSSTDTSIARMQITTEIPSINFVNPDYQPIYLSSPVMFFKFNFPVLPPIPNPATIYSTNFIWGNSSSGIAYYFNNTLGTWYYGGNSSCISVGCNNRAIYCYENGSHIGSVHVNETVVTSIGWYENSTILNPDGVSFTYVEMADDTHIWAIGNDNNVYKFVNSTWNMITTPAIFTSVSIGFEGSVLGTDIHGNVYLYDGSNWNIQSIVDPQSLQTINLQLSQISVGSQYYYWGINNLNGNFIVQVNSNNYVQNVDLPFSQTPILTGNVSVSSDGTVWGVFNGILYRRDGITSAIPQGIIWNMMANGISSNVISISPVNGPGPFISSNSLSTTWSSIAISSNGQYQLAGSDNYNNLWFSKNYGVSWIQSNVESGNSWTQVAISSNGQYQNATSASGSVGSLWLSTDYGNTWTQNTAIPQFPILALAISSSGQYQTLGYPANTIGGIIYSNDYGNTWNSCQIENVSFNSIAISMSGQFQTGVGSYSNGNPEGFYIWCSSDYGVNWTAYSKRITLYSLSSVAMNSTGKYQTTVGGTSADNQFILYSQDYGVSWTFSDAITSLDAVVGYISMDSTGQFQTCVYNSYVWYSNNYGINWTVSQRIDAVYGIVAVSSTGQYQAIAPSTGSILESVIKGDSIVSIGVGPDPNNPITGVDPEYVFPLSNPQQLGVAPTDTLVWGVGEDNSPYFLFNQPGSVTNNYTLQNIPVSNLQVPGTKSFTYSNTVNFNITSFGTPSGPAQGWNIGAFLVPSNYITGQSINITLNWSLGQGLGVALINAYITLYNSNFDINNPIAQATGIDLSLSPPRGSQILQNITSLVPSSTVFLIMSYYFQYPGGNPPSLPITGPFEVDINFNYNCSGNMNIICYNHTETNSVNWSPTYPIPYSDTLGPFDIPSNFPNSNGISITLSAIIGMNSDVLYDGICNIQLVDSNLNILCESQMIRINIPYAGDSGIFGFNTGYIVQTFNNIYLKSSGNYYFVVNVINPSTTLPFCITDTVTISFEYIQYQNCIGVGLNNTIILCDNTQLSQSQLFTRIGYSYNNNSGTDWIMFPSPPLGIYFLDLTVGNIKTICSIDTTGILYNYIDQTPLTYQGYTGYWQPITSNIPSVKLSSISYGLDGSLWGSDIVSSGNLYNIVINGTVATYEQITYLNLQTQISLGQKAYSPDSKTYSWGVDLNNTIYVYYYGTIKYISYPTIIDIVRNIYINVSYDGTVWATINGLIFYRAGITSTNPYGISWQQITTTLDPSIISLSANCGPSNWGISFPQNSTMPSTYSIYPGNFTSDSQISGIGNIVVMGTIQIPYNYVINTSTSIIMACSGLLENFSSGGLTWFIGLYSNSSGSNALCEFTNTTTLPTNGDYTPLQLFNIGNLGNPGTLLYCIAGIRGTVQPPSAPTFYNFNLYVQSITYSYSSQLFPFYDNDIIIWGLFTINGVQQIQVYDNFYWNTITNSTVLTGNAPPPPTPPPIFTYISVGYDGTVYGIDTSNIIYSRQGITSANLQGTSWLIIQFSVPTQTIDAPQPPQPIYIYVYDINNIYILLNNGDIYSNSVGFGIPNTWNLYYDHTKNLDISGNPILAQSITVFNSRISYIITTTGQIFTYGGPSSQLTTIQNLQNNSSVEAVVVSQGSQNTWILQKGILLYNYLITINNPPDTKKINSISNGIDGTLVILIETNDTPSQNILYSFSGNPNGFYSWNLIFTPVASSITFDIMSPIQPNNLTQNPSNLSLPLFNIYNYPDTIIGGDTGKQLIGTFIVPSDYTYPTNATIIATYQGIYSPENPVDLIEFSWFITDSNNNIICNWDLQIHSGQSVLQPYPFVNPLTTFITPLDQPGKIMNVYAQAHSLGSTLQNVGIYIQSITYPNQSLRVSKPYPYISTGWNRYLINIDNNTQWQNASNGQYVAIITLLTGRPAIVIQSKYYEGTENWMGGNGPDPENASPESRYISEYEDDTFMFGYAHSGGGSRAGISNLGISQSLYNASLFNFNYFAYTCTNSGGGYVNFKLNYKSAKYQSGEIIPYTGRIIPIYFMLDQYYQISRLKSIIISFPYNSNKRIGFCMVNNSFIFGNLSTSLATAITYWNWCRDIQLGHLYLANNTPQISLVSFDIDSAYTLYNNNFTYISGRHIENSNTNINIIISRCDKNTGGYDNMSIPIAVWNNTDGATYATFSPDYFPAEFTPSSTGTYKTPNSNKLPPSVPGINRFILKTDNIILSTGTSYSNMSTRPVPGPLQFASGLLLNTQVPIIKHGWDYNTILGKQFESLNHSPYTNCQLTDGMYTSGAAVGTVADAFASKYPQLIGSYSNPTINSELIWSSDGGVLDNIGLVPLIQRRINNIFVSVGYNKTISSLKVDDATKDIRCIFGFKNQGSGFYPIIVTPSGNTNYSSGIFPQQELGNMWLRLTDNFYTYGIAMATYKHTFCPTTQACYAYGFDDIFYGPYSPPTSILEPGPSYQANIGGILPAYYPVITWMILQRPATNPSDTKAIAVYITENTPENITLKISAFWKMLYRELYNYISQDVEAIELAYFGSLWYTYKKLITDSSFPFYSTVLLKLTVENVKGMAYYTSALSDYYFVPWIKKNGAPFHMYLSQTFFIALQYLSETNFTAVSTLPYQTGGPGINVSGTPFVNNNHISIVYCPRLQFLATPQPSQLFAAGGYIICQDDKIVIYYHNGNSSEYNTQSTWCTNSNIIQFGINNIGDFIISNSKVYIDYKGNVFICSLVNSSSSTANTKYTVLIVNYKQLQMNGGLLTLGTQLLTPNLTLLCSYSMFVGTPIFNTQSCMLISSCNQNKLTNAPEDKIYVGTGQSGNPVYSNLWISIDHGLNFNPVIGNISSVNIIGYNPPSYTGPAAFTRPNSYISYIVETCKQYRTPPVDAEIESSPYQYFQFATITNIIQNVTGYNGPLTYVSYLTFITEPFNISLPIPNPTGSQYNYCQEVFYQYGIYGIEYCPTIELLVVAFSDINGYIQIELYNCTVNPATLGIGSTSQIVKIQTAINLPLKPTQQFGLKYIGKQLLMWVDNILYSLTDIDYNPYVDPYLNTVTFTQENSNTSPSGSPINYLTLI